MVSVFGRPDPNTNWDVVRARLQLVVISQLFSTRATFQFYKPFNSLRGRGGIEKEGGQWE